MSQPLESLTRDLIDAALRHGAEAADAIAMREQSVTIGIRGGVLEQADRAEGVDIGLRVLIGGRQAIVSASDTSSDTIIALAERGVAMAREAPEDPHVGLADAQQLARGWDLEALQICDFAPEPTPATLAEMAREAESSALGVAQVTQVQSATAGHSRRSVHMAASNGFSGGYDRSDTGLSCVAIAGTSAAMERDHDGDSRIHAADLRSPSEIGTTAARRAVERLGARKPPTGVWPVLFDERVSGSLVGHLLAASNGAAIARGGSWLRDSLGVAVLPESLSIVENPHRPRVSGSRPFDAEGLPTRERRIVENGVLTGWTLDLASARKLGMAPTANAMRGTSSPPSPGNWNIALTEGDISRTDLISQMGTGLLVTSMIGSTINPNTGDYSRGAAGFWIERGEIAYPVNECTIAGSLPEMLRDLIPANDARRHLSLVVPSLLVARMTVAGT